VFLSFLPLATFTSEPPGIFYRCVWAAQSPMAKVCSRSIKTWPRCAQP
jgi:hypothetical protein